MVHNPTRKVVVAGHICIDITPEFPSKKISDLSEILSPGKLINMEGVNVHTGGTVANTGLALKIFGADVSLMGKVGNDPFGDLVIKILKNHDAADEMIISNDSATSYSIVLAPEGIDRIFLHNPGANNTFTKDDLDYDKIKDAALFHFGYPPLMRQMYLDDGKELINIFKEVKALGVATSLDMAAVDSSSEAGQVNWKYILKEVIPYVDFFVPSVEELLFMMDQKKYHELTMNAQGKDLTTILSIDDVKLLADRLMEWGAKVVLIKCGVPGLYFATGSQEQMEQVGGGLKENLKTWANIEYFEKSYVPDQILSATGAGDTCIAAFLYAMLEGYAWEECLQLATGTGASCVAAYDALSGIKPLNEILSKINAGWKKQ